MHYPLVGVLAATLVTAGFCARGVEASGTDDVRRASIVVRTYTLSDWERAVPAARRTTDTILGRAGVDVGWLECGLPTQGTKGSDPCAQPLRWNEVVVRIVAADTAGGGRELQVLGSAFVDLETGGGSLAIVYADRVWLMARNAGINAADLLGRAMAHEIGHLLLGTNQHAARGLMRASWSSSDLRRRLAGEWLFGSREGDVMRTGIAARANHADATESDRGE